MTNNVCPVCGYTGLEQPPAKGSRTGSHEICPCCHTQFGYTDWRVSHEELRQKWIGNGMKWWSKARRPPKHWDPVKQLRDAGFDQHAKLAASVEPNKVSSRDE